MHSWVFAIVRFFPYWALPFVLIFLEMGGYFKRSEMRKMLWACWALAFLLFLVIGCWFFFRGDLHSDEWVRSFLNSQT